MLDVQSTFESAPLEWNSCGIGQPNNGVGFLRGQIYCAIVDLFANFSFGACQWLEIVMLFRNSKLRNCLCCCAFLVRFAQLVGSFADFDLTCLGNTTSMCCWL